jgi:hypothetical protein
MDKTGFYIRIPSGQKVIISCNITELYTASLENRVSITIIKSVSSISTTIAPVLIILGKMYMESWHYQNLDHKERILLSDSSYTNAQEIPLS